MSRKKYNPFSAKELNEIAVLLKSLPEFYEFMKFSQEEAIQKKNKNKINGLIRKMCQKLNHPKLTENRKLKRLLPKIKDSYMRNKKITKIKPKNGRRGPILEYEPDICVKMCSPPINTIKSLRERFRRALIECLPPYEKKPNSNGGFSSFCRRNKLLLANLMFKEEHQDEDSQQDFRFNFPSEQNLLGSDYFRSQQNFPNNGGASYLSSPKNPDFVGESNQNEHTNSILYLFSEEEDFGPITKNMSFE